MKKLSFFFVLMVLVAAGAMALAGCSYGTSSATPPAGSTNTAPGASGTGQPPVATASVEVSIADYAFSPAAITVKAGTTVTWTNKDSASHTVTGVNSAFDSGAFGKGKSFSRVFDQPGSYDYYCSLHTYMKGKVIVE